jgi:oxygen-independent coproporphyrinogen-3 oxidase
MEHILSVFKAVPGAELAVEVDPRVTTAEHLDVLANWGFNRISMGVQDFTPKVQEAIERVQSVEETSALVEHARSKGYTGINIDLIYGLPFQTPETFGHAVNWVIGMKPDRVAVYSFAFVPWMRAHMKKLLEDALPDRDTKFALFCAARDRFLKAGYDAIGMDHFALPTDELAVARREGRLRRNFQGYTVIPANDVIGLGISAIGDMRGIYVQNHKKLSDYKAAVDAGSLSLERGIIRTDDDEIRRDVIHDLMCIPRVDIPRIEKEYDVKFSEYFEEDLRDLAQQEKEGLVEIGEDLIRATPTGEVFIRNVAMCFDRYWREKHSEDDKPVFSRTV